MISSECADIVGNEVNKTSVVNVSIFIRSSPGNLSSLPKSFLSSPTTCDWSSDFKEQKVELRYKYRTIGVLQFEFCIFPTPNARSLRLRLDLILKHICAPSNLRSPSVVGDERRQ